MNCSAQNETLQMNQTLFVAFNPYSMNAVLSSDKSVIFQMMR